VIENKEKRKITTKLSVKVDFVPAVVEKLEKIRPFWPHFRVLEVTFFKVWGFE
jgi:hypothetical protein